MHVHQPERSSSCDGGQRAPSDKELVDATVRVLPSRLRSLLMDPDLSAVFVREHHPLISQMGTFISRRLRMVLTKAESSDPRQPKRIGEHNPGVSSLPPKSVLAARLFCAAADGDVSLLQDTSDKIRLWHTLTQEEERKRKEVAAFEAHLRAKRRAEVAQQRKLEQVQLREERDARRALTTTMLAVQLLKEEEERATGSGEKCSRGRSVSPRGASLSEGKFASNSQQLLGSTSSTTDWNQDTNDHGYAFGSEYHELISIGDPNSRRSSLAPNSRRGSVHPASLKSFSRTGSQEISGRRRSSGYYLSNQLHMINAVPSMAGSVHEDGEDEVGLCFDIPPLRSSSETRPNQHLRDGLNRTNSSRSPRTGFLSSTAQPSRRSSVSNVDFMNDAASSDGSADHGVDEEKFDAGEAQARRQEALERALNNTVPFLHAPFNILHYAAFSNSPEVVEFILVNQDVVEKLGATVSASAQARVYRYNAAKHIADMSQKGKTRSKTLSDGDVAPHNDPSSIHFFTHYADGKAVLDSEVANGSTPLHIAAAFNNAQMTRLLLAAGADPKLNRGRTLTPLFDCLWLPSSALYAQHLHLMSKRLEAIRCANFLLESTVARSVGDLTGSSFGESMSLVPSGVEGASFLSHAYGLSATFVPRPASPAKGDLLSMQTTVGVSHEITELAQEEPQLLNSLMLSSKLPDAFIDKNILISPVPWRAAAVSDVRSVPARRSTWGSAQHTKSSPKSSLGIRLLPVPRSSDARASDTTKINRLAAHTTVASVAPIWNFEGAMQPEGHLLPAGPMSGPPRGGGRSTHPPFHEYVLSCPLYASVYVLLASGCDSSLRGCGVVYPPKLAGYHNPLLDQANLDAFNPESTVSAHDAFDSGGDITMPSDEDPPTIASSRQRISNQAVGKATLLQMQYAPTKKYQSDLIGYLNTVLVNVRSGEFVQRHRRSAAVSLEEDDTSIVTTLTGDPLVGVERVPTVKFKSGPATSSISTDITLQLEATTTSSGHPDSNELSLTGNHLLFDEPEIGTGQLQSVPHAEASTAVSQFLRLRHLLAKASSQKKASVNSENNTFQRKITMSRHSLLPPLGRLSLSSDDSDQAQQTSARSPPTLGGFVLPHAQMCTRSPLARKHDAIETDGHSPRRSPKVPCGVEQSVRALPNAYNHQAVVCGAVHVGVGDYVTLSSSHFEKGQAASIQQFDEIVARSTQQSVPYLYSRLPRSTCKLLVDRKQRGMSQIEINENYQRIAISHTKTPKGIFKENAPHQIGASTTELSFHSQRRQSAAVSFVRLPSLTTSAGPEVSRGVLQPSGLRSRNSSTGSSMHNYPHGKNARNKISNTPLPTKTRLPPDFYKLLRSSVVGRVVFVGRLPAVLEIQWLRSHQRNSGDTSNPPFKGLVPGNRSLHKESALGNMLAALGAQGAHPQDAVNMPDEVFVGLVLECQNPKGSPLGNCDGTYFGDGKRYFHVAHNLADILNSELPAGHLSSETRPNQQQSDSFDGDASFNQSMPVETSLLKCDLLRSQSATSLHRVVEDCNSGECGIFLPLSAVQCIYTSRPFETQNIEGTIKPRIVYHPAEYSAISRRWLSTWKRHLRTSEPSSPIQKSQPKHPPRGVVSAAQELRALLRQLNTQK